MGRRAAWFDYIVGRRFYRLFPNSILATTVSYFKFHKIVIIISKYKQMEESIIRELQGYVLES